MRFVVVGLHAAGRNACAWLRRLEPQAEIVGVDPAAAPPYARPLISHVLAGEIEPELLYLNDPAFFEHLGVTLHSERAVGLDADRSVLGLASGRELAYDALLVATGSTPRRVALQGAAANEVCYFRGREDLERIEARIKPGGVAAVLGGGLVGFKLTMGLLSRGMRVLLVVASPRPLSLNVDEHVGNLIGKRLAETPGIELLINTQATRLEPSPSGRLLLSLDKGGEREVDLVAAGKGVAPCTEWLGKGLADPDGLVADDHLQTKAQGVFVAGDAARVRDCVLNTPQIAAIWPMAVEQARYAAWNMAGQAIPYPGGLAMNSIPFFDGFMVSVGLVNPRFTAGCEFLALEPAKGSYLNLVFREGRLVGAVGLNAAPRLGELAWAVRRGLPRARIPETWLRNTANAAPLAGAVWGLSENARI